jgi:hypothetical protein
MLADRVAGEDEDATGSEDDRTGKGAAGADVDPKRGTTGGDFLVGNVSRTIQVNVLLLFLPPAGNMVAALTA